LIFRYYFAIGICREENFLVFLALSLEISILKRISFFFVLIIFNQAYAAGIQGDEKPETYFPNCSLEPIGDDAVTDPEVGQPIILIVIDALRPDHLGSYGYSRATSPAIDKFASQGVIFTRFFANSPWTRTATASMLTGRIPTHHRVQCDKHRLPEKIGTIAQQLKDAGYTTIGVVGNGNASSAFGLNKGFDIYDDTISNWKGLPTAKQVFDLGIKHLKKHAGKNKIFLLMFVVDPHDPYRPKPPYDNMFMPDYKGKIVNTPRWEYKNKYPDPVRKKIVSLYDGLIRSTDDQVKELFENLGKLGFYDRSSIFITTDHGEAFGEHGIYKHGYHLYETHIRIPLIIRAPWLKERGRYSSAFLQQIDLFPTFSKLAGAKVPDDMQGLSIVDALRDRTSLPIPRYVISEYNCYGIKRSSIRTRAYKLIYQQPADRQAFMQTVKKPELLPSVSFDKPIVRLFKVLTDPNELNNLAGKEKKKADKLLKILKEEIDDKLPPRKVQDLDPHLIEELRSMGYVD
jgi:arylsulfatase A-like enzyme